MSLAIVLVSGGLDSCVTAAIAARRPLAFLHLRYRQRTEEREFAAFSALADHFQVETRLVVDVDYMRQIGGSSLVDAT
ncbi:MAG: 7-cyano-7-deazaguanine synthase, partial [Gemmatimonadetes bacterium]|nr:7-cyano-7-deazaguanine synthase [Gemmatimonadota bacterium]